MMQVNCTVVCPNPECAKVLDFTLNGEAELIKKPDTLTVQYLPIVIVHSCEDGENG